MHNRDSLTGLLDYWAFEEHLSRAVYPTWVVLLDLDAFASVNYEHGPSVGDDAVRSVASVLLEIASRLGCDTYRVGGDEFAFMPRKPSPPDPIDVAHKLQAGVASVKVVSRLNPHRPTEYITASVSSRIVRSETDARAKSLLESLHRQIENAKRSGDWFGVESFENVG